LWTLAVLWHTGQTVPACSGAPLLPHMTIKRFFDTLAAKATA
jgi:hypothetical protein